MFCFRLRRFDFHEIVSLYHSDYDSDYDSVASETSLSISSDSVYDSVAYDPVKTRLSESEEEVEEPTNRTVRNRTLSLVYSSASACDSDKAVFT